VRIRQRGVFGHIDLGPGPRLGQADA
jgi:hypothetical protein